MIQIPNETLRQRILKVARLAFHDEGFHGASIRTIARRVGTTKSNIYTYFSSKDELFCKVVESTLEEIDAVLRFVANQDALREYLARGRDLQHETVMLADFVHRNRENLRLILLQSAGTSLEGFRERFIHSHNQVMEQSLPLHARAMQLPSCKISHFFIHFISSTMLGFIEEVVRFDLAYDEILQHAGEYTAYHTAGLTAVLSRE